MCRVSIVGRCCRSSFRTATHVLSLLAAVAVLLHNYRAIAAGSGVALVLLACLAAVFGGAVQPLLVVLFRVYRVQDKRRDHAVPLTQRLPQDLQVFGVPRKRFIGVTDDTVSNLNDLEFSKAAFGQGAGPHDTPPHTPRSSEGGSRDTPSGGTHSAARHLRKFNPRTCVVVDCRRYAALAYAVNAAAAVLFFGVAYYFTAPWCPGDYGLFWAVLGVALACDAAVVQPLQVGLTALGRWVTAEADEAPVHDVVPIHAQWCYVGAVCQTRSDALALRTPSTSLLTGSLTGSRSASVPRSRRTLSAASSAGLASGAGDAPCGAVRNLSSGIDLVDSVPSEVSSDLRASDGDDE